MTFQNRKFYFLLIFFFQAAFTNAQLKTFTVEYDCFLTLRKSISANESDSIKIIRNGDTVKMPKGQAFKMPKSFEIKSSIQSITTIGNSNSSKIMVSNISSNWKNSEEQVQYDSLVYKNKTWFQYINNKATKIGMTEIVYSYADEEKEILGYKCVRVNFYLKADTTIKGIMWVANSLPSALMPFGGYEPLNGAVLECSFINSGMVYKVKSVNLDHSNLF